MGLTDVEIISHDDLLQAQMTISFAKQKLTVSVFMIDGMLVDTGPAKKKAELFSLFNQWDIAKVVLTHHHEDHTGAAHWLQTNKDVPIYIHESGINDCEAKMKLPPYRKVFWGERDSFSPEPLGNTFSTENYDWDVIHTPGHAHDHIVLLNKEKGWLFGGDLYVQPKPKSLFAFESVPEIIESLKKVLTYDFDTYICSHAGIRLNGKRDIEKKLSYLEEVQGEVLLLSQKGMTPRAIRKQLFPKRHPMHYVSFFENSPKYIVNSILR